MVMMTVFFDYRLANVSFIMFVTPIRTSIRILILTVPQYVNQKSNQMHHSLPELFQGVLVKVITV